MLNPENRIGIVGAGAAGLAAAHYLREAGFHHVTVLERLNRLGGKCLSIPHGSRSFDLGANYVTQDYKEVRRLARSVGAELYTEAATTTLHFNAAGEPQYVRPLNAVKGNTSFARFVWKISCYLWKRWRLRNIIDMPGFAGIADNSELCVSFAEWLDANGLTQLSTLFEVPVTIMGYGYLHEIPAPYALKYMSAKTFVNLVSTGLGLRLGWPKRFVQGFQVFWERIAVDIDVRLDVQIDSIQRDGERVLVRTGSDQLEFDYLILACPLAVDDLSSILDLTENERAVLSKITINPYIVTTYTETGLQLPERIVGMLPVPELGTPFAITQQFEDNTLIQFYSRIDSEHTIGKDNVLSAIRAVVDKLGGAISSQPHTYDEWSYFPHFATVDIRAGIYDDLEALQGQNRTYYCGGVLAFELVEPIVRYSKHLVHTHFGS